MLHSYVNDIVHVHIVANLKISISPTVLCLCVLCILYIATYFCTTYRTSNMEHDNADLQIARLLTIIRATEEKYRRAEDLVAHVCYFLFIIFFICIQIQAHIRMLNCKNR